MTRDEIATLVERLSVLCTCNPDNPCAAEEACLRDREVIDALLSLSAELDRTREAAPMLIARGMREAMEIIVQNCEGWTTDVLKPVLDRAQELEK